MFEGKKAVLQFSGGKDSLACLYFLRPYWDQITVLWCNTGAAFPETLEQMARIQSMVPHFIEIRSNQPLIIAEQGMPADVVPVSHTPLYNIATESQAQLIQSYMHCCGENIWKPMHEASKSFDVIIRGQKSSDHKRAPIKSGHVEDGIQYYFPIEHWTDAQVLAYLKAEGIPLPPTYDYFGSSADCWDCTAYLSENIGKRDYLKKFHPEKHAIVEQRLHFIRCAVEKELECM